MGDTKRFKQLIENSDSCISIVTYEEHYALDIIRQVALDLKCNLWIWFDDRPDFVGYKEFAADFGNTGKKSPRLAGVGQR